ncbi:DUF3575 domain-containing protein [Alistipes sp. OttesenSCG-928-B03]|nr:DUF3575 domain-containing protein [Alistipes sp. OttesenSCG-928-B03]
MRKILLSVIRQTIMLVILTASVSFVSAQGIDLNRQIVLPQKTTTRQSAIQQIEQQTEYRVAYHRQFFDDEVNVNFTRTNVVLSDLMDRMLDGSGMVYRTDGNYILITGTPSQTAMVNIIRNLSGRVIDNETGANAVPGATVEIIGSNRKTTTDNNGQFHIRNIASGKHIIKLTTDGGETIRYREITIPDSRDADITLSIGEIMHRVEAEPEQTNVIGTVRSTAYYVPTVFETSSFTDQPTEMFVVSAKELDHNYKPRIGVKTNLLYLATTTLNLGVEFGLARKWTLDITAGVNPWDLNDDKGGIRHWLVQPEVRYWFCNRFERHFIGLHGIYGEYEIANVNLKPFGNDLTNKRYNGWGAGGGVSYGYHLPMGKRWGWEFTVGAGYIYLDYDKYNCGECDNLIKSANKHYWGITKAGISLILMIK